MAQRQRKSFSFPLKNYSHPRALFANFRYLERFLRTVIENVDHGETAGLTDDDHTQYLKEKAEGGLAAEIPLHDHSGAAEAGTVAHSDLTGITANDHHDEAHTVASHSDTTATGAELEELTDGSETTLHSHAEGGTTDDYDGISANDAATDVSGSELETLTDGSDADSLHTHGAFLENVVEDTTPQLGGNLDMNGNDITDAGGADVEINKSGAGALIITAAAGGLQLGTDAGNGDVTISAHGAGEVTIDTVTGTELNTLTDGSDADSLHTHGAFLENVVEDTTPQLGGNLDAQSNNITSIGTASGSNFVASTSFEGPLFTNDGDITVETVDNSVGFDLDDSEDLMIMNTNTDLDMNGNIITGVDEILLENTVDGVMVGRLYGYELTNREILQVQGGQGGATDPSLNLYGASDTTYAGDYHFYGGGELVLQWDESEDEWVMRKPINHFSQSLRNLKTEGVHAYRITSDQSIPNTTVTAAQWNAETFDSNSFHDNSTNPSRFTVPTDHEGLYWIMAQVYLNGITTGDQIQLSIYINGSPRALNTYVGTTFGNRFQVGVIFPLSASDYVELAIYHDGGSGITLDSGYNGNSWMAMGRLV